MRIIHGAGTPRARRRAMPAAVITVAAFAWLPVFAQAAAPAPPAAPDPPPAAPDAPLPPAPAAAAEAAASPDDKHPGYAAPKAPPSKPAEGPPPEAVGEAGAPAAPSVGPGVAPTPPEQGAAAPSERTVTTYGGPAPASTDGLSFEFHGYFRAPLRVGMGEREAPGPGQSSTTFHAPVIPDDQYLSWQYTRHNPRDWAELYFSLGNKLMRGTVSIQGYNFAIASWNQVESQFGIAEGYVTLTPDLGYENVRLEWKVGSFSNRYGEAGRYDAGEYDTYLFGRTRSAGETLRVELEVDENFSVVGEHGIGAKRADPSIFTSSRFTLLNHAHGWVKYRGLVELGLHYLASWAQEEDRDGDPNAGARDGSLAVYGPDVRVEAGRFGYLYAGYSHVSAKNALVVAPAIEVIHSLGGGEYTLGVTHNYLEAGAPTATPQSGGNGSVDTFAGQYEFSVAKFLDEEFWGEGRDLILKLYGMVNLVSSRDPDADGVRKLKYGTDGQLNLLPWLGAGIRYDRVQPNSRIAPQSFSILSPRLVFRSNWLTHEEIVLQYSRYFYNRRTCPQGTNQLLCARPAPSPVIPEGFGATQEEQDEETRGAPTTIPDQNVFSLQASMWW